MKRLAILGSVTLALTIASSLQAQAVGTPCTAPTDIYTGSGIPTENSLCGGTNGASMYLGVSQRYTSPLPTTDGNGNWYAQTGDSQGAVNNVGFAKWNFNFATRSDNGALFRFTIFGLGVSPLSFDWTGDNGDSSNLGYLTAFGFSNLDEKAYTFRLDQYASTDGDRTQSLGYIQEVVNVSAVPEPSTYALMAAGLAALGVVARRRRNRTLPA